MSPDTGYRGGALAEEAVTLRTHPFRYYRNKAGTVDVRTPPDRALFYSGRDAAGVPNGARAEAMSRGNGGHLRIEDTPGGRWMNDQKLYEHPSFKEGQADMVWTRLSERYATQARGEVNAFVNGARPDRVFYRTEYPILQEGLKSGRVTNIVLHE